MTAKKTKRFKRELSAGAVIFRESDAGREFLILHYLPANKSNNDAQSLERAKRHKFRESWSFPKGKVEKGESIKDAARREIREETGLKEIEFVPNFSEKIHYFFMYENALISKSLIYFLAKIRPDAAIKISEEHAGYEWLKFEEAAQRLTHKNDRDVLEKAEKLLQNS